ncbi:hypothetical protein JL722_11299 [Aureococcus anophagefferens]|nr:hypothetical protein JL722_11299 [Aureococcus anophagefferens]
MRSRSSFAARFVKVSASTEPASSPRDATSPGDDSGDASPGREAKKRSRHLASIRRQVSYYLSDENLLKGDAFVLRELRASPTASAGLDAACDFKKMRKLLAGCDAFALVREALDEAPGTTIVARDGAATRTVEVRNVKRGADAASLEKTFAAVGAVEDVSLAEDERGKPTAAIRFAEELGAIRAVEELNDADNWRFGLRVALASGKSSDAARRDAKLPVLRKEPPKPAEGDRKPAPSPADVAAAKKKEAEEKRRAEEQALRDAEPPIPEGRARGKLVYFKEGKYGFIRPNDGTKKEDNAFFALSELTPKNLATKLKIGDYLEYAPEQAEKPKARDVRRCAGTKYSTRLQCPADAESRAAKDGDEAADRGAAGPALGYGRRSLNLKPKTKVGDDEPPTYGPSKIAKGPDGTPGFARARTSAYELKIDAAVVLLPRLTRFCSARP